MQTIGERYHGKDPRGHEPPFTPCALPLYANEGEIVTAGRTIGR